MTPIKRSTLQLDLKDISSRSTGPNIGRATLVAGSLLVVSIAVASMNIPTDEMSPGEKNAFGIATDDTQTEKKTFKAEQVIVVGSRVLSPTSVLDIPPSKASQASESSPVVIKQSDVSNKPDSNAIPLKVHAGLSQQKSKTAFRSEEIQLASLAPIPSIKRKEPVVNQIEADPVAAQLEADKKAVKPLPLSVTQNDNIDAEPVVLANAAPLESLRNTNANTIIEAEETKADPAPAITVQEQPEPVEPEIEWTKTTVKKKDTLSQIFNRLGLSSKEAYKLVKLKGTKPLVSIRPGQIFEVVKREEEDGSEKLSALRLKLNRFDTLHVKYDESAEQRYQITTESREPEVRQTTSSAKISGSLLGAAKRSGIPYDTVYELATIFGWQVDFSKDIQKGDAFKVVHEELFLDDVKVGDGAVIAAELVTGDKSLRAIRHVYEDNHVSYFAPDGDGIQGSFLRSPIKFARVSSKFSKKRFHPIKKKWKAHKGVDYSAPMNTPIRATGDGMIKFAGTKKGYGKTVIVRHGGKYETVYAHMNRFKKGKKKGARVKQGDIIGYVGKTGWATGPHLHYEFRVAGKHMNPLTVELPKSAPIEDKYLPGFRKEATKWVAALKRHDPFSVASKD